MAMAGRREHPTRLSRCKLKINRKNKISKLFSIEQDSFRRINMKDVYIGILGTHISKARYFTAIKKLGPGTRVQIVDLLQFHYTCLS